ncbi:MAG: serine/threonine protein kinase [Verrucomicrobiaceae bacterium]|nr:serine/threonine protein kinase [Verrucomicrobiaceae bacterium]
MNPRYELLEKVAESGQGVVWCGVDRETGQKIAVKKPGGPSALTSIAHPHVVRVLECAADAMVMEWIDGETLEARGRLDATAFDALVRQSLDGLAAIHDSGFLHLDLKPDNILISDSRFQISDFGCVKPITDAKASLHGSVHYMAPECFEGGMLDARADLYALGCVFYFALTGRTAFEGELKPQVITAHLQHRFEPLPERVPQLLRHWVGHLLARKAAVRPASARDALQTYRAIAEIMADA